MLRMDKLDSSLKTRPPGNVWADTFNPRKVHQNDDMLISVWPLRPINSQRNSTLLQLATKLEGVTFKLSHKLVGGISKFCSEANWPSLFGRTSTPSVILSLKLAVVSAKKIKKGEVIYYLLYVEKF